MSYNTIVAMANSQSLIARVAACAAALGNSQPRQWSGNNILAIVATAPVTLTDAWDSASADANANPDTGHRNDVITDDMILQAVTARKNTQVAAGDITQGWPT